MNITPKFQKQQEGLIKLRKSFFRLSSRILLFLGLLAFVLMIYDIGFKYGPETEAAIHRLNSYLLIIFFVVLVYRFLTIVVWRTVNKSRWLETVLLFFFVFALTMRFFMRSTGYADVGLIRFFNGSLFTYMVFLYVFVVEVSRRSFHIFHAKFSPALLFIYSFLLLIISGAGLLLLPRATYEGISITDAFFTSTSAVCVTGLIVVDTATYFTPFGKTIILVLIQLGGLGIMTFTSFFALLFQQTYSFQNQLFMQDLVNEDKLGQTFRTIFKIVGITLGVEAVGASFIYFNLDPAIFAGMETTRVKFAIFHAISAFCNAGFSTLTDGLYDSRIRFNYTFQLVITWLVIFGGIGFPIIFNLFKYLNNKMQMAFHLISRSEAFRHRPRLIQLNTKLVLATTAILLTVGTIIFFLTERNNVLLEHPTVYGKLVTAFFGSVTPRTAGFNTVNMAALTAPTVLIYLLLMWIGASPGSTGGGIKTTTFAVAFLNIVSIGKARDRLEVFQREIPQESVKRALAVIFLSFMVIGSSIFLITVFDPQHELIMVAFEAFSAFSTVGLSLGLTGELNDPGKLIIMFTMFTGRVGLITFILGFFGRPTVKHYQYPGENIIIS